MISVLYDKLFDPQFMLMLLAAIAAAATVLTLSMPLIEGDDLERRMKAVSVERERIRAREREKVKAHAPSLRQEPKAYMKQIVEQFKLDEWMGLNDAKQKLQMAGFRGPQAEITFLFFRLVLPIGFAIASFFYIFVLLQPEWSFLVKMLVVVLAGLAGMKAPEVFLKNAMQKRQQQMKRAWPDALDLMLICVEAGMSIEHAFRRVGSEIGTQSMALAEEMMLATAELSYLPDRRVAYDNLSARTGLESVKSVTTALVQAEKYGTPLGQALRVLAQESRDARMMDAEKKAAALPPKLTVPMVLFFLPVLIVVIMTPAVIQVMKWK
jgi:tight adherence protein C